MLSSKNKNKKKCSNPSQKMSAQEVVADPGSTGVAPPPKRHWAPHWFSNGLRNFRWLVASEDYSRRG